MANFLVSASSDSLPLGTQFFRSVSKI